MALILALAASFLYCRSRQLTEGPQTITGVLGDYLSNEQDDYYARMEGGGYLPRLYDFRTSKGQKIVLELPQPEPKTEHGFGNVNFVNMTSDDMKPGVKIKVMGFYLESTNEFAVRNGETIERLSK